MKILYIEPTPSPNVMKCNLDQTLPEGVRYHFHQGNKEGAPEHLRRILAIEGVKSVFQVLDFLSIERYPKASWPDLLSKVAQVFDVENGTSKVSPAKFFSTFGEVKVQIQKLRGIPYQIKLIQDGEEKRFALPKRFQDAVMKVHTVTSNLIFERKWIDHGVRYGEWEEIGQQLIEEISAAYDEERLERLVERAMRDDGFESEPIHKPSAEEVRQALKEKDWRKRYAALEWFEPSLETIDILETALQDKKPAIRRLAVVYLGLIGEKKVFPYLVQAMKDPAVMVRRTAGDTLSDLGWKEAIPIMCEALQDPNKLVRWRAARFLYEVGDETARSALKKAIQDPEFEVQLQARMALERIERGEEASGTVWQQMTRAYQEES